MGTCDPRKIFVTKGQILPWDKCTVRELLSVNKASRSRLSRRRYFGMLQEDLFLQHIFYSQLLPVPGSFMV